MAWTTPRTWTTGELVTAAIMNAHVRDEFTYLKASPTFDGDVTISRSNVGGNVIEVVKNTDNTNAASNGVLEIDSGGGSAGDPYVAFGVIGATNWSVGIDNSDGDSFQIGAGYGLSNDTFVINTAGSVFINDNSNAKNTLGLTINQGANDDEALSFKSSDVAHGMTTPAEADTYGLLQKLSPTAGGLEAIGYTENGGAGNYALSLKGNLDSGDTTKNTSAGAAVRVYAGKKSGTSVAAMGANENCFAIDAGGNIRFIFDADGDSHEDVGTAWTNFDAQDDVAVLNLLSAHLTRPDDPLRENFGAWLSQSRRKLERLKLVTFNDDTDGHAFLNTSKLAMLLVGAVRQQSERIDRLVDALIAAGTPRAALKGV